MVSALGHQQTRSSLILPGCSNRWATLWSIIWCLVLQGELVLVLGKLSKPNWAWLCSAVQIWLSKLYCGLHYFVDKVWHWSPTTSICLVKIWIYGEKEIAAKWCFERRQRKGGRGGGQREGVWGSGNVSNNMVLLKYQMVSWRPKEEDNFYH